MTMDVYGQDVTSPAAYSRQQAYDSNLQEIRKKREMRRQRRRGSTFGGSKQNTLLTN